MASGRPRCAVAIVGPEAMRQRATASRRLEAVTSRRAAAAEGCVAQACYGSLADAHHEVFAHYLAASVEGRAGRWLRNHSLFALETNSVGFAR
eukprot:CAMPEP_0176294384 /NCGR_PEP_ID=MMETSP0121_2-20121125/57110_1 /TAXON_ID=160619 /ORGANISM="Kryptoperidinium foliaceum, Strain CCMP 1326" /LENGTH=92 /DNA_ID=CAMNT_0017635403 /DNA_START=41 /DNA_END=319 /DNA_ORIENTATION=+